MEDQEWDANFDAVMADVLAMEEGMDVDDIDVLEFHPLQLMCFEDMLARTFPCLCHGYMMIDPAMNVKCNFASDFEAHLMPVLVNNPSISGVYFVCGWACSMFYSLHPVFYNPIIDEGDGDTSILRGVTIHITENNRRKFVEAIAKLCEGGFIPCQYLRKMEWDSHTQGVYLFPEEWFGDLIQALVVWQENETQRLYDAM